MDSGLRRRKKVRKLRAATPLAFLFVPLGTSTLLCSASILMLGSKLSNLLGLLAGQQGQLIKLAGSTGQLSQGSWRYVVYAHMGIIWWSYWRKSQLRLNAYSMRIFNVAFIVALGIGLLTSIIQVDRTSLIPMMAGVLILFIYEKASNNGSVSKVIMYGLLSAGLILAAFLTLSFLRGASGPELLITSLMGYTVTSYNRLAAVLHGLLRYPFAGHGIYISTFLSFNNSLNAVFPFHRIVNAPAYDQVFLSEFRAIWMAGLRSSFNWTGAFGYLFADMGWWTPVYLIPVGMIVGLTWSLFKRDLLGGIILYPWCAFSIVFWVGTNILFDNRMAVLTVVLGVLTVYERLFLRRIPFSGSETSVYVDQGTESCDEEVTASA